MSSSHQVLPESVLSSAARIQALHIERVVSFIDRFTARVMEKLEAFDKKTSHSGAADPAANC
jgi:hypothetical protein